MDVEWMWNGQRSGMYEDGWGMDGDIVYAVGLMWVGNAGEGEEGSGWVGRESATNGLAPTGYERSSRLRQFAAPPRSAPLQPAARSFLGNPASHPDRRATAWSGEPPPGAAWRCRQSDPEWARHPHICPTPLAPAHPHFFHPQEPTVLEQLSSLDIRVAMLRLTQDTGGGGGWDRSGGGLGR